MNPELAYAESYADIYDLVTKHKDYKKEVDVLLSLLSDRLGDKSSILSIGCGTGSHEIEIARQGHKVIGIDKSADMVRVASSKAAQDASLQISFSQASRLSQHLLGEANRCVISLFNVVNCLDSLDSLHEFFSQVHASMEKNGIFFFEAWNGLECLLKPPSYVLRHVDLDGVSLFREAIPSLDINRQLLDIRYIIKGMVDQRKIDIESHHRLRLFTVNELIYLLRSVGFHSVSVYSALPDLQHLDLGSTLQPRMISVSAFS